MFNTFKGFLLNTLIVLLLVGGGLFFFFSIYLPSATHHGEMFEVPELKGMKEAELEAFLESKRMKYEVIDSVYSPEAKPRTVITQNPASGALVKEFRKIYVTVSSAKPPLVKMPKLVDFSIKNAEIALKTYDLKVGEVTYMPHFTNNVVLKQLYKGNKIEENALLPRGSVIDLVVSSGASEQKVALPDLEGLSLAEAGALLQSLGLEIGSLVYEQNNKYIDGTVVKQKPTYTAGDSIQVGQIVDVWVAGKDPRQRVPEETRE